MKITQVLTVSGIILLVCIIAASGSMIIPMSDTGKERSQAPEHSPAIGENSDLVRIDFIHYVKPTGAAKPAKTTTCYKPMGVSWKSLPVTYIINPSDKEGLSDSFITETISGCAETWDDNTSVELFSDSYTVDQNAQYGKQDYKNVIQFGPYDNPNVIAITSVWYSPVGKRIVEFDMLFNEKFEWGDASANSALMDLQNIATHELGHAVGLADLYTDSCKEVTMYGYSTEGETIKRTLETPDINGLRSIYED